MKINLCAWIVGLSLPLSVHSQTELLGNCVSLPRQIQVRILGNQPIYLDGSQKNSPRIKRTGFKFGVDAETTSADFTFQYAHQPIYPEFVGREFSLNFRRLGSNLQGETPDYWCEYAIVESNVEVRLPADTSFEKLKTMGKGLFEYEGGPP